MQFCYFLFLGYYADTEAKCQVFHICITDDKGALSAVSFLCPNGTIFNQNYFICDWWFNFECSEAENLYSLNDKIAAEREELAAAASDVQSTYSAANDAQAPASYAQPQAAPAPASYYQPQGAPSAPPAPQANYEKVREGRSKKIAKPFVKPSVRGFWTQPAICHVIYWSSHPSSQWPVNMCC